MKWSPSLCGVLVLLVSASQATSAFADERISSPPQFLLVSGINEKGELIVPVYQNVTRLPAGPHDRPTGSSYLTDKPVSLEGVRILTAQGKVLAVQEGRKRLIARTPILVMSDGESPSPDYLKSVTRTTLIFVFPGKVPTFEPARWPVEGPGKQQKQRVSDRRASKSVVDISR